MYLTNPSIRSALFAPVTDRDEAMGDLVETAVYSQWFHSDTTTLHYARWNNGEVDMVYLKPDQKVMWAMETKWSDRYYEKPEELRSLCSFCHSNNLDTAAVTTIGSEGVKVYKNTKFVFRPASLHSFMIGANLIRNKQLRASELTFASGTKEESQ